MDLKNEKLLIIHMDDIGMSHAANIAAMELYDKGIANSGSIMIPCSWAHSVIRWWKEHPQYDIGVHLTHTCEWEVGRWRPLASRVEAPGLYDEDGFMWRGYNNEIKDVPVGQVRLEMELQMEQALRWGLRPSHMDTHMFVTCGTLEFFRAYLETAAKYDVTVLVSHWALWDDDRRSLAREFACPVVTGTPNTGESLRYKERKEQFYSNLQVLEPGLNLLTTHPVADTPEIRAIIPQWEHRVLEYRLLMDDDTMKVIRENGIRLVTWKEMNRQR
jgi:chitin disaccharide deacetylase